MKDSSLSRCQPDFIVSVIIPVYNAASFLRRCVQSALDQEETCEIILVEDNSEDHSLEICLQLVREGHGKITLIQHADKLNHGPGLSRNLGAKHASSPYLAFLDADDYYLPNRFTTDREVFLNHPEADGSYNALGTNFEDDVGKAWYERNRFPLITTMTERVQPSELFFKMNPIGSKGRFSFDALTLKRVAFVKTPQFSKLKIAEDTLLLVQISLMLRLYPGELNRPVAMRGVHRGNRVQSITGLKEGTLAMFDALAHWIEAQPVSTRHRHALHRAHMSKATQYKDLVKIVTKSPALMLSPRTWFTFIRWMLCRRYPTDPLFPGLRNEATGSSP